jgi:hypothetical protein
MENGMRLSPGLRLLVSVILLAAATGAIWWLVGLPLSSGLLRGSAEGYLRRTFGFDEAGALRLVFLAFVVCFTAQVAPSAGGKWLSLGAIAVGVLVVEPQHTLGATFSMILLVLCVPAIIEMGEPLRQAIGAAAAGFLVALPPTIEQGFAPGPSAGIALFRGVLYVGPLLFLSPVLDRLLLKRVGL